MSKKLRSDSPEEFSLQTLADSIQAIHVELSRQASKAVNVSLTIRNWLIGFYIAEYELNGADRAEYGEKVLDRLAEKLADFGVSTCQKRRLYGYLRFFQTYPDIVWSVTAHFKYLLPVRVIEQFDQTVRPVTAQLDIEALSYTHIEQLVALESDTQRDFYQTQCVVGGWSVRELKRQINSLLFERTELSSDKTELLNQANQKAGVEPTALTVRDPYVFDFLGLKPAEVMSESHLEDQLLDHLHQFLIELGQGFCFEARQKRILIGDTHNFVDLVFYHRILKCHVLVELKLEAFSHENVGQLNTYVSWYDKNVRPESDNPPVGILLCTEKDHAMVEYALAGMDNDLFVSKYQLALPAKEELERQIEMQRQKID